MVFSIIFICIRSFNINDYGFYRFSVKGSEVVNIDMSSEANVILQYPHQTESFLEAKIITSPENSTNHFLDTTQDAVVSGSLIQLRVFNSFSTIDLLLWVIPKHVCPLVSFTLPNEENSFSITFSSSKLPESFCVFTYDYQKENTYYFGSNSNSSITRFEIYSSNPNFPHDVCYDYYCKIQLNGSIFFWFRNAETVSMKSFIQIRNEKSTSLSEDSDNSGNNYYTQRATKKNIKSLARKNNIFYQTEINPLPYYNSTSKYNVGRYFDEKNIYSISDPISSRKALTFIATMIAVGVILLFLLLKILDGIIILWKSKKTNGLNANGHTTALPITLVLNHYCPNTSAKIVMPNY